MVGLCAGEGSVCVFSMSGRSAYFAVILSFVLCLAGMARAETIAVSVRQVAPDGRVYNARCDTDSLDLCHVFMGVVPVSGPKALDDRELDVGIVFKNGKAYFQFKSGADYFVVSDKSGVFSMSLNPSETQSRRVALFAPSPMASNDPANGLREHAVVRPKNKIADLEISVEPVR